PVPDLTSGVILAGKTMPVKANGPEAGLKANTLYNIKLDGPGGTVIGALQSDASGNIETSVIIPAITPPGGHTIDIIGPGQTGGTLDVTQPVYVPQNQDDADGDGAFNGNDSCPIIRNSGQDTDKDGVDDVCDGLIGLPPANPTSGSSGSISGSSATKQTPSSSFKNSPGPAKSSSSKLAKSPNLTPRLAKTTLQNNYRSERRFFWLILVFVGICLLILGFCLGRLRDSNEQPAYA
ncbi:MAG TPA: hypothetical protein VK534_01065, partial [Methylomirabilota bacterium]|nr:hypothetical protein [Methylomirabilota bacterium]